MARAVQCPDITTLTKASEPGSFCLEPRQMSGLYEFRYICPCGCGVVGRLLVGEGFKPGGDRPSWIWNGSKSAPTLNPSVNHEGHWHGWLRDGHWVLA
tara:strand:+ start:1186 stop:1479 length:294 start_codon:yes stop_codon:yes gene_type:complete